MRDGVSYLLECMGSNSQFRAMSSAYMHRSASVVGKSNVYTIFYTMLGLGQNPVAHLSLALGPTFLTVTCHKNKCSCVK